MTLRSLHLGLPIPEFNAVGWHTDYIETINVLDGLLYGLLGITDLKGAWKNSTTVSVGERYLDNTIGAMYQVLVTHTTSASPAQLSDDRTAHPTYWQEITVEEIASVALLKANNLADLADAATARATLGVVIGTDVQAQNTLLTNLAAATFEADRFPYTTGSNTWGVATVTSFARTLLDDANPTEARETLGIGTAGTKAFLDQDDFTSNSADAVPSQQSVKAYVDARTFGVDQMWQNLSGSRFTGTYYQNTLAKPIQVHIIGEASVNVAYTFTVKKDGTTVTVASGTLRPAYTTPITKATLTLSPIIPAGAYYRLTASPAFDSLVWSELR